MKLLVLGGTAFLGRAIVQDALARDIDVTCLARGTQPSVATAHLVRADRDEPSALAPVTRKAWDAVIDLTSQPRHARTAAREITATHWVYISTSSVYACSDQPDRDESAPICDPLPEPFMTDMTQYGSAKVACENAYRENVSSLTVIRPGLIGGAGDTTGRSGYYPWRFAHPTGPDVLVPDDTFPTALLDVEDLAAWTVDCAVDRIGGVFNAAGSPTTLGDLYVRCQGLSGGTAVPRVVDDETLVSYGVRPWMGPRSLPLWVPDPALRNVAMMNTDRALSQGLRRRPLNETLAAAARFEVTRGEERGTGLSDAEEEDLRRELTRV